MADDFGMDANGRRDAAIALGKPFAEFVDYRLGLFAYCVCVSADEGTRKNASRPPGKIVPLQARKQLSIYFRLVRNLVECNATLHSKTTEVGAKGVKSAHAGPRSQKADQ
ncbi:MAG TPA: hypothetical protein VGH34_02015, partial [Vicinamibacterales bacterium]